MTEHHTDLWELPLISEDKRDEKDYRDQYSREYARLIHSAAFRRLQNKTQVLGLGENDFYRTRLTHSLEVMQIGSGIVQSLLNSKEIIEEHPQIKELLPKPCLIESICLAHDIGHPPFGHGGEIALNYCMLNHGGFEGNGQTLRILTKLEKYQKGHGINPSRRLTLGILKYPAPYSKVVNKQLIFKNAKPFSHKTFKIEYAKPPKCYLDTEANDVIDWLFEPLSKNDKKSFTKIQGKGALNHSKTVHKSFDTLILELADDISYGVHDLEDGIGLKLILEKDWNNAKTKIPPELKDFHAKASAELFQKGACERKKAIGSLVHLFISNISVSTNEQFSEPLLKYSVSLDRIYSSYLDVLKSLTKNLMVMNPNVQLMEYKGMTIIIKLFEIISSDPERFLPKSDTEKFTELPENEKPRFICDYIAGMTDSYATKIYEKVTLPGHGSFLDLM